jgi:glycogen debranching enzyme
MSAPSDPREARGLLPRFTLKDANTFLIADALGDIQGSDDGFFSNDTRILSRFEIEIAGRRPSLLGAAVSQDNTLFTSHLTNRPLPALGERSLPQGVIHIERSRLLCNEHICERVKFTNFSSDLDAQLPLKLTFDADFADIFEVQGHVRKAHGTRLPDVVREGSVCLSYRGLDERLRETHIRFSQTPTAVTPREAQFIIDLPRTAAAELFIEISMAADIAAPSRARFERSLQHATRRMEAKLQSWASIDSSAPLFNQWINRSRSDLALLTTDLGTGPYPYAGIPWFATQFGRDAIITSLQTLWVTPQLAAGVLRFLASTQAQEASRFRDSEPGKIMHETRRGEMAALKEVPFGLYYGGVDTTPLFVMLAGAYEKHTGDRSVADAIWSNLLAATGWIERRLEQSTTGFLDYARGEDTGLVNQAWKDSHDSIFLADGRFPTGPIAVVEVQGYAYAALKAMARLGVARGETRRSVAWDLQAERLREAIEKHFWMADKAFYAIALSGEGEPCRVLASNAGHLLYCGVPSPDRALAVAKTLTSARFASGWGIRTLASGEVRYNPMAYHNGSIWPHDTALCAAGISKYGGRALAARVLTEIFEAANHFAMRLPELYCGFPRTPGQGPAPYPVACLPQAWASGSVFMLLQAILGLEVDGPRKELHIGNPVLPEGIASLTLRDLRVCDTSVDLEFHRIGDEVVPAVVNQSRDDVRILAHLTRQPR